MTLDEDLAKSGFVLCRGVVEVLPQCREAGSHKVKSAATARHLKRERSTVGVKVELRRQGGVVRMRKSLEVQRRVNAACVR